MNRHVNAIAGRLSLRPPQRRSLEILDRITEIVPPRKGNDLEEALTAIRSEFPTVTDFEREFPSLCFALATGVGKTRLMGAFISYLHLAHGINNFFVLAPNLAIYNKLITDFTPNTPKYVFKGDPVNALLSATGLHRIRNQKGPPAAGSKRNYPQPTVPVSATQMSRQIPDSLGRKLNTARVVSAIQRDGYPVREQDR